MALADLTASRGMEPLYLRPRCRYVDAVCCTDDAVCYADDACLLRVLAVQLASRRQALGRKGNLPTTLGLPRGLGSLVYSMSNVIPVGLRHDRWVTFIVHVTAPFVSAPS